MVLLCLFHVLLLIHVGEIEALPMPGSVYMLSLIYLFITMLLSMFSLVFGRPIDLDDTLAIKLLNS